MIDPEQNEFRLDFSFDTEELPPGVDVDFHPGEYDALIDKATPLLIGTREEYRQGVTSINSVEAATDVYIRSVSCELHRMFMSAGGTLVSGNSETLVRWQADFCEQVGQSVAYWESERIKLLREKPGRVQKVFSWLFSGRDNLELDATEEVERAFLQDWRKFTAEHILKMNGKIDVEVVLGEAYREVIRQLNLENQKVQSKNT